MSDNSTKGQMDTTQTAGLLNKHEGWVDGAWSDEVRVTELKVIGEDIVIVDPGDPGGGGEDPPPPWDGVTPPPNAVSDASGYHAEYGGTQAWHRSMYVYTTSERVGAVFAARTAGSQVIPASDKKWEVSYVEMEGVFQWANSALYSPIATGHATDMYVGNSGSCEFYIPVSIVPTHTGVLSEFDWHASLGGQVFAYLYPTQTVGGVAASSLHHTAESYLATKTRLDACFSPRIIDATDHLPGGVGVHRVIYAEDFTKIVAVYDDSYTTVKFGEWKAYDFVTLAEAQAFLDSIPV